MVKKKKEKKKYFITHVFFCIVARIFSAKFRRQLSLNFSAQTAATVLSMPEHVTVMCQDWARFDFDGILDQTLWVCECDTLEIRTICTYIYMIYLHFYSIFIYYIVRQDVYGLLANKNGIEDWMKWLSNIVQKYLKIYTPVSTLKKKHL